MHYNCFCCSLHLECYNVNGFGINQLVGRATNEIDLGQRQLVSFNLYKQHDSEKDIDSIRIETLRL